MLQKALDTNNIELKEFNNNMSLYRLFEKAAEYWTNRMMEQMALIKPLLTKKEAYAMFNKMAVDRAIRSGELKTVKKGGKTSNIYIPRKDFEIWILKSELAHEAVTKKK